MALPNGLVTQIWIKTLLGLFNQLVQEGSEIDLGDLDTCHLLTHRVNITKGNL